MKNVGKLMKRIRLANDLTQEEFGERIGLQKSAVAKYENGKRLDMKRSTIVKICEEFNVSPLLFFTVYDENEDIQKASQE